MRSVQLGRVADGRDEKADPDDTTYLDRVVSCLSVPGVPSCGLPSCGITSCIQWDDHLRDSLLPPLG